MTIQHILRYCFPSLLPTKKYSFQQDRTRDFANRVPDMTYLIYDEQKLGLQAYLSQLETYTQYFYDKFLAGEKRK
jgi:hypothetical protein